MEGKRGSECLLKSVSNIDFNPHLSNDNSCNWYEFAQAILKDKNVTVSPVTSAEYPQKAWRPRHSILDLSKTKATGFKLPTWQEALAAFMQEIEK